MALVVIDGRVRIPIEPPMTTAARWQAVAAVVSGSESGRSFAAPTLRAPRL